MQAERSVKASGAPPCPTKEAGGAEGGYPGCSSTGAWPGEHLGLCRPATCSGPPAPQCLARRASWRAWGSGARAPPG